MAEGETSETWQAGKSILAQVAEAEFLERESYSIAVYVGPPGTGTCGVYLKSAYHPDGPWLFTGRYEDCSAWIRERGTLEGWRKLLELERQRQPRSLSMAKESAAFAVRLERLIEDAWS